MDTDASGFTSRREDPAKDGGIPDLSRQEARLWFYYRATRYIDCGYEVLHMGQVYLYTANDKGMAKTTELFGMILRVCENSWKTSQDTAGCTYPWGKYPRKIAI